MKALEAKGIRAAGFPTDLADQASVRTLVSKVRESLGPITVLAWSAYSAGAGDLLAAELAEIRRTLDIAVTNLLMVVQAALPDLKAQKDGAILVINGGLGYFDAKLDAAAVQWNTMGLSVANAAKHKLVGVLAKKLQSDGVYVGEAMVLGSIKGAAFDNGSATIAASTVAAKLWDLYRARTNVVVDISEPATGTNGDTRPSTLVAHQSPRRTGFTGFRRLPTDLSCLVPKSPNSA